MLRLAKSRVVLLITACVVLFSGLSALSCTSATTGTTSSVATTSTKSPVEPLNVGGISAMTGPAAVDGIAFMYGAKLAIAEINAAGGIKSLGGAPINFIMKDAQTSVSEGRRIFQDMVSQQKVSIIIGPYGTALNMVSAPLSKELKTPSLGLSIDDAVLSLGGKYYCTLGASNKYYVQAMYEQVKNIAAKTGKPITKVGIIAQSGSFGEGLLAVYKEYAPKYGLEVLSQVVNPGSPDLQPIISRFSASGVQAMMIATLTGDTANILRSMAQLNIRIPVVGGSGTVISSAISDLGKPADLVVGVAQWTNDIKGKPELQAWQSKYEAAYGEHTWSLNSAHGYVLAYFMAEAVEQAGSRDGTAIADALHKVKLTSGPAMRVWPPGELSFDESGQYAPVKLFGVQIQNGKYVTIWPDENAAKPLATEAFTDLLK